MKKVITAILSLALVTCLAIYSCQKDKESSVAAEGSEMQGKPSALRVDDGTKIKMGWSPLASKVSEIDGGLAVTAPSNWSYIGYDKGYNLVKFDPVATKTITCTCNTSGTCKPFKSTSTFGSTQGCVGTCTNCTMKQSMAQGGKLIEIGSGGYYSSKAETRLLKNGESAPAVFDALLDLEAFQKEFARFINLAYRGKKAQKPVFLNDGTITAPEGHSLVAISIMGRGMGVILPDSFVASRLGHLVSAEASCSCSGKGACALKSKSILLAGAYWCEGDCTSCTLTTTSLKHKLPGSNRGEYVVHLTSYAY